MTWSRSAAPRAAAVAVVVMMVVACAGRAFAQDPARGPAPLAALQQSAEKRAADWEALARALDAKIARMLPCDPRVAESIEEVSRSSEARLAALSEVMKAAVEQAEADAGRIQLALSAEDASLREAELERTETLQERVAVDAQLADLTDSARRRESLEAARKKLAEIAAMTAVRATLAEQEGHLRASLALSLRDVLTAFQARLKALQNQQAALALEASRWNEYYAARRARAQTECTITAPAPSRRKKKA